MIFQTMFLEFPLKTSSSAKFLDFLRENPKLPPITYCQTKVNLWPTISHRYFHYSINFSTNFRCFTVQVEVTNFPFAFHATPWGNFIFLSLSFLLSCVFGHKQKWPWKLFSREFSFDNLIKIGRLLWLKSLWKILSIVFLPIIIDASRDHIAPMTQQN